eukprot:PhF_6_TR29338/c0_g1_i2/m.43068
MFAKRSNSNRRILNAVVALCFIIIIVLTGILVFSTSSKSHHNEDDEVVVQEHIFGPRYPPKQETPPPKVTVIPPYVEPKPQWSHGHHPHLLRMLRPDSRTKALLLRLHDGSYVPVAPHDFKSGYVQVPARAMSVVMDVGMASEPPPPPSLLMSQLSLTRALGKDTVVYISLDASASTTKVIQSMAKEIQERSLCLTVAVGPEEGYTPTTNVPILRLETLLNFIHKWLFVDLIQFGSRTNGFRGATSIGEEMTQRVHHMTIECFDRTPGSSSSSAESIDTHSCAVSVKCIPQLMSGMRFVQCHTTMGAPESRTCVFANGGTQGGKHMLKMIDSGGDKGVEVRKLLPQCSGGGGGCDGIELVHNELSTACL